MPNEQAPPPDPGEQPHEDETIRRIHEVIQTMGGTGVTGYNVAAANIPRMPGVQDPDEERRDFIKEGVRATKRKAFLVERLIHEGAEPPGGTGDMLDNALHMNVSAGTPEMRAAVEGGKRFMFGNPPGDRFSTQHYGAELAKAILNGAENLDMVDLVLAIRASMHAEVAVLKGSRDVMTSRSSDRFMDLERAYLTEILASLDPTKLFGEDMIGLVDLYSRIHHTSPETMSIAELRMVELVQALMRDRLTVSDVVMQAGLWTMNDRRGVSPYARPKTEAELDQLDDRAADTIERLHLLKAYGVTPFEVSAGIVQLPWDIAVVPPLDVRDGESAYADGAVVDFLLLDPDPNRDDIRFQYERKMEPDREVRQVSVGGTHARMRLRLHDNGQISHGFMYHNVPSDAAETAFTQDGAGNAFRQIRGLLISLAFDALVPDNIIRSRPVGGSTATRMAEQPADPTSHIAELLLRRRRVLEQARVSERNQRAEGWAGPTMGIAGYIRRLPGGTQARPTAEQEAREYFDSINVRFDGLPEGHTFVGAYDRRVDREITYRRARFRRDSQTRRHLRGL
jgi:hypothetical protein